MKYIALIIGLLLVRCGKQEKAATAKPVKELTLEEKVVGAYEIKANHFIEVEYQITGRYVILENGVVESYRNDKKSDEHKWKIVDGDIHVKYDNGAIDVYRINKDGSLNGIALIEDGKRFDFPKEYQHTFKKIK